MTQSRFSWVALVFLVAAGCRSRSDLVEAELRTRDRQLRETQGELMQATTINQALENTLRAQQCNQPVSRPCTSGFMSPIKDIQLGRGTGGVDENRVPGDQGLMVVLVPRDIDDSPIKAPGTLRVTALQISPEGIKSPLSTWDVSALKLRQSWRTGLFSTGYFVPLPWQSLPTTEKLRIVATFCPLEGGQFEAEKDITIKLSPDAIRCPPTTSGPAILGPPQPATGIIGPALPNNSVPTGPPPRTTAPTPPPLTPANPTTEAKSYYPPRVSIELGRPDGVERP
jgi:hypothetical protein